MTRPAALVAVLAAALGVLAGCGSEDPTVGMPASVDPNDMRAVALDCMTRDIREAGGVTGFTTNTLWLTNQDGSLLEYNWDTNQHCLFCYNNNVTNLLLTNCICLQFSLYQRTPSNGTTMVFFPLNTNAASKIKVVVVNWACAKTNYATLTDSESVQTAKIVLRN